MTPLPTTSLPIISGPGSIRLCPGQSPTDVDGSLSPVMKAHWASITTFIHMAGRNRDQDFLDLCSDNNLSMTSPIESTLNSNLSSLNWSYKSLEREICGYFLDGLPRVPGISRIMRNMKIKKFPILSITSIHLLRKEVYR